LRLQRHHWWHRSTPNTLPETLAYTLKGAWVVCDASLIQSMSEIGFLEVSEEALQESIVPLLSIEAKHQRYHLFGEVPSEKDFSSVLIKQNSSRKELWRIFSEQAEGEGFLDALCQAASALSYFYRYHHDPWVAFLQYQLRNRTLSFEVVRQMGLLEYAQVFVSIQDSFSVIEERFPVIHIVSTERPPETFEGSFHAAPSQKLLLKKQPVSAHPLYTEALLAEAPLKLSASSIQKWMACPRQFYYTHSLGLRPDQKSFRADLGRFYHQVMETFFEQDTPHGHVEQWLAVLEEILDRTAIAKNWSPLQQLQVLRQGQKIAQSLEKNAFFQTLPAEGLHEVKFTMTLGQDIFLTGRLDSVFFHHPTHAEIVDYKTSRHAYASSQVETSLKTSLATLEPIDFRGFLQGSRHDYFAEREVQLPLYWFLLRHTQPQLEKIDVSIQTLRVPTGFKKDGTEKKGCQKLTLTHEQLQQGHDSIEALLRHGVVAPMVSSHDFLPEGDAETHCPQCDFLTICPGGGLPS
jgi:RecB family exonuclease